MLAAPMPEELTPGFVFGGYVIRECIGRGGMARVYRAEHTNLHKAVALKVLDQWVLGKPGGRERFLREARTAAAIKHPNVVDIVDVGVWGERPYIVMELLSGCDLEAELERRGELPDTEVAGLALPVIAGMIAVHEAGVVHRDIKPSNIFLCRGPEGEVVPKVLDFGISKFSDNLLEPLQGGLTKTREIVGTPTYMAPEALNGARELGPRADQYALGAVLYDCAVGHPPFDGDTLLELLKAIALGAVEAPRSARPGISIALEDAILRAMNGNPDARFETLRDLGRALWPLADERTRTIWARSFGGVPPRASQPTRPLAVRKQRSRLELTPPPRRGWVPVLGAAGVLGAFLILWRCTGGDSTAPKPSAATPAVPPSVGAPSAGSARSAAQAPSEAPAASGTLAGQAQPAPGEAAQDEGTLGGPAKAGAAADSEASARAKRKPPAAQRQGSALRSAGKAGASKNAQGVASGATAGSAAAELDPDLREFFVLPPELPQPGPAADDSELRGLFPADDQAVGANGAPLPD